MSNRSRDRKKLIERVQALLEKTVENGATPAEAASAAAKAQELLLKYNIEEVEIAASTGEKEPIIFSTIRIAESQGDLKEWRRTLLFAIARTNFCKGYTIGSYEMGILGRKTNILVVQQIYLSLFNQLTLLLEKDIVKAREGGLYGGSGNSGKKNARKFRSNWLLAAARVVQNRLLEEWRASQKRVDQERESAGQYTTQTSSLMVIDQENEALKQAQAEKLGKVGTHRSYTPFNPFSVASAMGALAGSQVHISQGLDAGSSRKELEDA